jgi:hypothetical protein
MYKNEQRMGTGNKWKEEMQTTKAGVKALRLHNSQEHACFITEILCSVIDCHKFRSSRAGQLWRGGFSFLVLME